MTAGTYGGAMPPDNNDDPFAYLYRPEGGQQAGQVAPARPPESYHNVRPVGERSYGGAGGAQQPGNRTQPDAHYAAPEAQPGAPPPAYPAPSRHAAPEPPRRNGLLIGAIAVVLAVVAGVGAAVLFSGDEGEPAADAGSETGGASEEQDGNQASDPSASDEAGGQEDAGEGLPEADLAGLSLSGIALDSSVAGSADGQYLAVNGAQGATITWTFELPETGSYRLYTNYSSISDGQSMSFSVNGTPREDPINMQDYNDASSDWAESWVYTYNYVDLTEGENTIQLACTASCDVLIDRLYLGER